MDEEDRAPRDPTVKIVGLPGQTRGSVGVVVELGERGGAKGVVERLGFSGGTVGFSTVKEVGSSAPFSLSSCLWANCVRFLSSRHRCTSKFGME